MKNLLNPADRATVIARLGAVRPDSPRRWGTMTPNQMLCHLADAFQIVLGRKESQFAGTIAHRTIAKWVILYTSIPFPRNLETLPEVNAMKLGTKPAGFEPDMKELLHLLQRFIEAEASLDNAVHPIIGRLTSRQWGRWAYTHMDHHLRQFGA